MRWKRKRRHSWYKWYAWRPICIWSGPSLDDRVWVWLEYVKRRRLSAGSHDYDELSALKEATDG